MGSVRVTAASQRLRDSIRCNPSIVRLQSTATPDYPRVMSEQDVRRFRARAQECLDQAERVSSQLDREAWLKLAEQWIMLAQQSEKAL